MLHMAVSWKIWVSECLRMSKCIGLDKYIVSEIQGALSKMSLYTILVVFTPLSSNTFFKSFLLESQDLKVNLCGLQQDIRSDGKSKKDCGNRPAIPML